MSNTSKGMPDESGLRTLLQDFRGSTAFEVPTTDLRGRVQGNHGDTLMHKVYRAIAVDAGIEFTSELSAADSLVVPPSGALLESYCFPEILRQRLSQYPDLPLLIFPSSTLFRRIDPGIIFDGRKAPTLLMLREEYSYKQLQENWRDSLTARNVSIALDHDVVASGHRRVRSILEDNASRVVEEAADALVVARLDVEARPLKNQLKKSSKSKKILIEIYQTLPVWGRRLLRSQMIEKRQRQENEILVQRLLASGQYGGTQPLLLSKNSKDISDPNLVDFAEYAQHILSAPAIVTNRLHVALPSAALGHQTYLMDTGYHKLRGVFERSLSNNTNVHLISSHE